MSIMQQRVCFLETVGQEYLMELVSEGMYLAEIIPRIDPGNKIGVTQSFLSRWLSGKVKREIPFSFDLPGIEGKTENRLPETLEQASARGKLYEEARQGWAESVVEKAGRTLMEEKEEKMASLRKAQSEFALRIASVYDKKYATQGNTHLALQVNIQNGENHLNALRRREVKALASYQNEKPESVQTQGRKE